MPSVTEGAGQNQLNAGLKVGLDTLSLNQQITFTKYVKQVLPLDGFVFWVRADLLSASALANASLGNMIGPNAAQTVITPAATLSVKGSLHYGSETRQDEDATYAKNSVIFTAQSEIQEFSEIGPTVLYLGTFDGIRFAFSSWRPLYRQAGIFHYRGDAVYSVMDTQIVDDLNAFDGRNIVVSNSLPIWLGLNSMSPPAPNFPATQYLPLYPSYLVSDDLPPPYGSVHIVPESTEAMGMAPLLGSTLSHSQLCTERVRITIYGLRNFNALDWQDYVFQYMVATDNMGLMNSPVMRDEKKTQSEMSVIAQKKSIEFKISYYQSRARNVAQQLILSCIPQFTISH